MPALKQILSLQSGPGNCRKGLLQCRGDSVSGHTGDVLFLPLGIRARHFAKVDPQGGGGDDALETQIQKTAVALQKRLVLNVRLHHLDLIDCIFPVIC